MWAVWDLDFVYLVHRLGTSGIQSLREGFRVSNFGLNVMVSEAELKPKT